MQIPFIKFLESLVVCRFSDAEIIERLEQCNLVVPEDIIQQVRMRFKEEQPEYFNDPTVPIEFEWLEKWGVSRMVAHILKLQIPNGPVGIEGALQILNDSNMYRVVTSLAFGKLTDEDIELMINGKYNIHYVNEDIIEFLHYFFKVTDWNIGQRKAYIKQLDNSKLQRFYRYALNEEKDYLVWKLGAAPNKSFQEMMKEMATDSFYNFKEHAKTDAEVAQRWGALSLKLADKFEKLEKETKDTKRMFMEDVTFKLKNLSDNGQVERKHISELDEDNKDG